MAKRIALGFIIAVFVLAVVAGGSIWVNAEVTQNSCRGVNDLRGVLTKILDRSRNVSARNPDYSAREKAYAKYFYTKALDELQPTRC